MFFNNDDDDDNDDLTVFPNLWSLKLDNNKDLFDNKQNYKQYFKIFQKLTFLSIKSCDITIKHI
jgi:hypothetical protein